MTTTHLHSLFLLYGSHAEALNIPPLTNSPLYYYRGDLVPPGTNASLYKYTINREDLVLLALNLPYSIIGEN